MSGLSSLISRGAVGVYAQGCHCDYDTFMRTTQDDKELVKDERDNVTEAFGNVQARYEITGYVRESRFCEAITNFDTVLAKAKASCRTKGVRAESGIEDFFRAYYNRCAKEGLGPDSLFKTAYHKHINDPTHQNNT